MSYTVTIKIKIGGSRGGGRLKYELYEAPTKMIKIQARCKYFAHAHVAKAKIIAYVLKNR